jgi:hypothetical protein
MFVWLWKFTALRDMAKESPALGGANHSFDLL